MCVIAGLNINTFLDEQSANILHNIKQRPQGLEDCINCAMCITTHVCVCVLCVFRQHSGELTEVVSGAAPAVV